MPVRPRSRRLVRAREALAVTLLATALAALLSGCGSSPKTTPSRAGAREGAKGPASFAGAGLPTGVFAPDFTLSDERGRAVSLASLRGNVVILAFVYTSCGAPCVVIAQQIRGALDELPHPVAVLLVSADPRADTRARIASFLREVSLSGRVRYLSGSPAELSRVWSAFHVLPASAGRAAFARATTVYLVDREGQERVLYQLEQLTPEALSHDVRLLG